MFFVLYQFHTKILYFKVNKIENEILFEKILPRCLGVNKTTKDEYLKGHFILLQVAPFTNMV